VPSPRSCLEKKLSLCIILTHRIEHTHAYTFIQVNIAHAYPLPISCLKIDIFLNDLSRLLKAGGCKTALCIGLNTAHAFENACFLIAPPTSTLVCTHALRETHSGCRWQAVCVRQETLCSQLLNRESGSLTCRQRFPSSPGE